MIDDDGVPLIDDRVFADTYHGSVYTTISMVESSNGWKLTLYDAFKNPAGRIYTNQRIAHYWFDQTRRRAAARTAMEAFNLGKGDTVQIRRPPDI